MKHTCVTTRTVGWILVLLLSHMLVAATCGADDSSAQRIRFQKPGRAAQNQRSKSKQEESQQRFREPRIEQATSKSTESKTPSFLQLAAVERQHRKSTDSDAISRKETSRLQPSQKRPSVAAAKKVRTARRKKSVQPDDRVVPANSGQVQYQTEIYDDTPMVYGGCNNCVGDCTCEVGCGIAEPGCAIVEPGCDFIEPDCAYVEPGCAIVEPGCAIIEPGCGLETPSCGSCVGNPGPDYWCFPVCLPRFKDLSVWAGVHGFRGPRDFSGGTSDSNFGFQEGINISGRAPLIGRLFPQLSYQLGYQAVQSRLSGTVTSADNRDQQFVTAGFFRRVNSGLQFGAVWDYMKDDLDIPKANFQQVRWEISIKSPRGREIGFWSAIHSNSRDIGGMVYQAVDQYALFYRWNFGKGTEARAWVGGTNDSEALLGAEFHTPLNECLSLQSGFNYLITDKSSGLQGVREEAWNVGINLVWHLGRTARRGQRSPFRPMFSLADNGWMFVDHQP